MVATEPIEAHRLTPTDALAPGLSELPKTPTGINGLDEVTGGGLPAGRTTLLAMEFLVRGITQFDEPGVFLAFEESADDLIANVASLSFDLAQFVAEGQLVIDH